MAKIPVKTKTVCSKLTTYCKCLIRKGTEIHAEPAAYKLYDFCTYKEAYDILKKGLQGKADLLVVTELAHGSDVYELDEKTGEWILREEIVGGAVL